MSSWTKTKNKYPEPKKHVLGYFAQYKNTYTVYVGEDDNFYHAGVFKETYTIPDYWCELPLPPKQDP